MSAETGGLDVFARHTDVDGKTMLVQHRVWDKELFLTRSTENAVRENMRQAQGQPMKARFEQITEEEYRKGRKS